MGPLTGGIFLPKGNFTQMESIVYSNGGMTGSIPCVGQYIAVW